MLFKYNRKTFKTIRVRENSAIGIQNPNTSLCFSEQHGEAYMRVLVHFLVSWHKQRLEPSPVQSTHAETAEVNRTNGNRVITKSPNTCRV